MGVCYMTQGTHTRAVWHTSGRGGDGRGGGREVQECGTYVHLWLIHVDVWQKPAQFCKAIIFQLKINLKSNTMALL